MCIICLGNEKYAVLEKGHETEILSGIEDVRDFVLKSPPIKLVMDDRTMKGIHELGALPEFLEYIDEDEVVRIKRRLLSGGENNE
jgi:hypothetical protein